VETDTLKLTGVLSDPTRYAIYQSITSQNRQFSVHEIADKFSIHPNVARLHLTKLEDVSLLSSVLEKTGKGGRPSRLYRVSDQSVNLQFPPSDYPLLADIAIQALHSLGDIGKKALRDAGLRFGREAANRIIFSQKIGLNTSLETKLAHICRLINAHGIHPEIEIIDQDTIRFRIYSCNFKEAAKKMPESGCQMHHTFLRGIFETFFGNITLLEENSIIGGCDSCNYTLIKVPGL
jgi:predicted ArsR family transcriptional regulator